MSLLEKMQAAGNVSKASGTHLNWFEKLELRDPKTAEQVFEVVHEYLTNGRVGDFYNKYDIYKWLLQEGIDLQASYSSFSRIAREFKARLGDHGTQKEENTKNKARSR